MGPAVARASCPPHWLVPGQRAGRGEVCGRWARPLWQADSRSPSALVASGACCRMGVGRAQLVCVPPSTAGPAFGPGPLPPEPPF